MWCLYFSILRYICQHFLQLLFYADFNAMRYFFGLSNATRQKEVKLKRLAFVLRASSLLYNLFKLCERIVIFLKAYNVVAKCGVLLHVFKRNEAVDLVIYRGIFPYDI